ncbi:MAG: hypothetical protein U1E81_08625 [Xanthobacteraceae bacterium]
MIFGDWTLYPLLAEVDRKLDVVIGQIKRIATTEAIVMADIGNLKIQVDNLVDKVKAQTSIDASVAVLVQDQVARLKELGDQIAALKADTVTQADIDAVAQTVSEQATALDQGTAALQAAVPANTSA